MRLPSINTIKRLTADEETARKIRRELEYYRDGLACNATAVMNAVNDLIGGHGVEYVRSKKDTPRYAYGFEYVNMGETYATTLLFDHDTGTFSICSWGGMVESRESRYI